MLAHLPSATDLLFLAISGVGGYIWSPKANANGARNVSYDNLSRCQRGGCGVQLCQWPDQPAGPGLNGCGHSAEATGIRLSG